MQTTRTRRESSNKSNGPQGHYLLSRRASLVILIMLSLGPVARAGAPPSDSSHLSSSHSSFSHSSQEPQGAQPASVLASMSAYAGRTVQSIEWPAVADRDHLLRMLPQKVGQPLDRDQVRESIRVLYSTGRFADIQAEATPSCPEV